MSVNMLFSQASRAARWGAARDGFLAALTFVPSTLALGLVFGASTGAAGISGPTAVVMSAVVWSGAGQFAALPLWPEGGGVIMVSTLALSLRFLLITASMAPLLVNRPRWMRALLAYCVTDENYALAVTLKRGVLEPGYLVGSWLPLYVAWLVGTALGVLVGAQVPAEWVAPLRVVFPMVFLVIAVLLCTHVPLALVAILGGVLSVIGSVYLPAGWNIVAAGLLASLAGLPLERLLRRYPLPSDAGPPAPGDSHPPASDDSRPSGPDDSRPLTSDVSRRLSSGDGEPDGV